MKKCVYLVSIFLIALLLSCGSIVNGTTQQIGITSYPSQAGVTINGQPQGTTPLALELSRKDKHVIKLELSGYQEYETTIQRHVSGWVWGNILLGGIIGLAIDAISGGMYKLSPEQVTANLATSGLEDGDIYLMVVMTPDPAWEKIGQFEPLMSR